MRVSGFFRSVVFSTALSFILGGAVGISSANAQDLLPEDNGLSTYHTSPRWRESESHPLRVLAYAVHPIGWALREGVFRPLSHFASSTEETRSIMGFREPYDYRQPECFSADDSAPDCRSVLPFNYDRSEEGADLQVWFPDINFDFNVRRLNSLGKAQVAKIASMLNNDYGSVQVVLEGHTDYIGTDKYNEKLGLDRAESVKSELVHLGIEAQRLSTVTFGESRPLFTEQEDWARAANRRVEVHPEGSGGVSGLTGGVPPEPRLDESVTIEDSAGTSLGSTPRSLEEQIGNESRNDNRGPDSGGASSGY